MPYVERDLSTGAVVGVFHRPQKPGQEKLADNHPDVAAYRSRSEDEPDPPITTMVSPGMTSRVTPSSTVWSPNRLTS